MAGVLDYQQPRALLGWGVMPPSVLGGQGDMYSGYTPTKYAVPGQTYPADKFMGGVASVASAPVRIPFNMGMGIGSLLDQANQAMPWGGNDPSAIGIDTQAGTIDPNVMVPFATNMAGMAATGGIASPKPAGAVGIFGGRLAKTADQAALAKAEQMAAQGASRDAIWAETGWFQGVDGKWRFEIPDNATQWPVPVKDWVSRNSQGTLMAPTVGRAVKVAADNLVPEAPVRLKRILDHEGLSAAYPDVPESEILLQRNVGGTRGTYTDGLITLNEAMQPDMAKSTMLHEIQHAIQQREGFTSGGNTVSLWNHSDPAVRNAVLAEWERLLSPVSRDEFAKGYSSGWSPTKAEVDAAYADYLKTVKKSRSNVYDIANKAAQETAAQNVYRRLAGETEARNVQSRMNMTPEERKATPPWLTQDVPDADQIVRMSVDGPQQSTGPKAIAAPPVAGVGMGVRTSADISRPYPRSWQASVGGKKAGYASMTEAGEAGPYIDIVMIDPAFRRQGIATQLYDQIEADIGKPLIPSPMGLSDEAIAFWKNRLDGLPDAERQDILRRAVEIADSKGIGQSARDRLRPLGLSSNPKESTPLGLAILGNNEATGAPLGIRAYHGSPHDFDKFSMEKIGTGEGAQAYGSGLYFAENEGVARSYRDALKRGDNNSIVHIGDRDFPSDMGNYYLRQEMEKAVPSDTTAFVSGRETYDFYNKELGDAAYRALKRANPSDDPVQVMSEAMDAKIRSLSPYEDELPSVLAMKDAALEYARGNVRLSPNGRMYEVSINASPDEFINYDAPWEAQPDVVKRHFSHLAKNGAGPDGSELARRIESGVWADEARNAGIKGIRYKDAGSRYHPTALPDNPIANEARKWLEQTDGDSAAAVKAFNASNPVERWATTERDEVRRVIEAAGRQPTHNYVVFDDNIIDILKKYGIAGLMAGGGAAGLLGGTDQASAANPSYTTGGRF